jgi:hypothetical protein
VAGWRGRRTLVQMVRWRLIGASGYLSTHVCHPLQHDDQDTGQATTWCLSREPSVPAERTCYLECFSECMVSASERCLCRVPARASPSPLLSSHRAWDAGGGEYAGSRLRPTGNPPIWFPVRRSGSRTGTLLASQLPCRRLAASPSFPFAACGQQSAGPWVEITCTSCPKGWACPLHQHGTWPTFLYPTSEPRSAAITIEQWGTCGALLLGHLNQTRAADLRASF